MLLKLVNSRVAKTGVKTVAAQYLMAWIVVPQQQLFHAFRPVYRRLRCAQSIIAPQTSARLAGSGTLAVKIPRVPSVKVASNTT